MSSLKIREGERPRGNLLMKSITYVFRHTGAEQEVELPAKFEICERCDGHGHHSNPAIDGNGISGEEMAEWDPDEVEGYFSGRYDIACEEGCDGGKALVVDERRLTKFQRILFKAHQENEDAAAEDRRISAYERKMGY